MVMITLTPRGGGAGIGHYEVQRCVEDTEAQGLVMTHEGVRSAHEAAEDAVRRLEEDGPR